MGIGENLKMYRKAHKMSQKDLAYKLNISKSYMSELESGKRNPSIETVQKIAEKLNISTLYLLEGTQTSHDLGKIKTWQNMSPEEYKNLEKSNNKQLIINFLNKADYQYITKFSEEQLESLAFSIALIETTKDNDLLSLLSSLLFNLFSYSLEKNKGSESDNIEIQNLSTQIENSINSLTNYLKSII